MTIYNSLQSLSGIANSSLISWRIADPHKGMEFNFRVVASEIVFGLLILVSTIELVAYAILCIPSFVLCPITNQPFRFFVSLLTEDITALIALNTNFFYHNLSGKECFSHSKATKR